MSTHTIALLILSVFLFGLPSVLIFHELGHVLGAYLVGFRVYRIEIGKPITSFTFWGIHFDIGFPYFRGRVWSTPKSTVGWKWRKAAVALAGPAMSSILATLFWILAYRFPFGSTPSIAFVLLGIVHAMELLNLLPPKISGKPTDGGNAIQSIQLPVDEVRTQVIASLSQELLFRISKQDNQILEPLQFLSSLNPTDGPSNLALGLGYQSLQKWEHAIQYFKSVEIVMDADIPNFISQKQLTTLMDECETGLMASSQE